MPTLTLQTPEGIELRTEIAGVGSRVAAAALDVILLVAGYCVLLLLLVGIAYALQEAGGSLFGESSDFVVGLFLGGFLLLFPIYFLAAHVLMGGRTPGKRMIGLRVVSASGYPASGLQYGLRSLLWLVDAALVLPVPIGMLLIAVTPRCRRLGDLVAGTLVIEERRRTAHDELWPQESWSARETKHLALTPGMAARLGEQDMSFLRDAIQRREMPRKLREQLYRDIVAHYAARLGFAPAENPRTSLKELYLFGREYRGA